MHPYDKKSARREEKREKREKRPRRVTCVRNNFSFEIILSSLFEMT